jgi:uncharacterized protein
MIEQREPQLQSLEREECLDLLGKADVGRLGYVVDGAAIILPVNFTMQDADIVFCTAKGGKLSWLKNHSHVAFEVDEGRPADREGWSVLCHGTAREVTDPGELDALRQGPMPSWVSSPADHWVRITIQDVSGRAIRR